MDLERVAVERTAAEEITVAHHHHGKPPLMRRTQSYNGVESSGMEGSVGDLDRMGCADSESPLHTSFDVSQLSAYRQEREASTNTTCTKVASFTRNYLDALSTSSLSSSSSKAKTPLRMRFPRSSSSKGNKASGKRTPASARRHRLFTHRLSPAHRTPALTTRSVSETAPGQSMHPPPPQPAFVWRQEASQLMDSAPGHVEATATPAQKKPPKRSLGTVTTVANSTILETTTETDDSVDTNNNNTASASTFRFSAFPASLPRIPTNAPQNRTAKAKIHLDDEDLNSSGHTSSLELADHRPTDPNFGSLEDFDDMSTSPTGTPVGRRRLNFNSVLSPTGGLPGTPKDVKIHFQSGQCSPIRGIPEEDGDMTKSSVSEKHSTILNQSLGSSTSGSSRAGRSRPMPDMNAFEGDVSPDISGENGGGGSSSRSHPHSPKLLCPPTPVRTPAWVHAPSDSCVSHTTAGQKQNLTHHKYGRQNSLIATKVLATCSQRDLEGRSSLENSLLEEDSLKQQNSIPNASSGNSSSILTYADSAAAGTEPETDHTSSDREHSSHHANDISEHNLGDDEDDWIPDQKEKCRLFDDDRVDDAFASETEVVSMSTNFEILGMLGRGTFADVYKVRSKKDGKLYAVKKHRRQFRGRRDREIT